MGSDPGVCEKDIFARKVRGKPRGKPRGYARIHVLFFEEKRMKKEGVEFLAQKLQEVNDARWSTKPAQTYFYQKDIRR